jgi:hypothetical protein
MHLLELGDPTRLDIDLPCLHPLMYLGPNWWIILGSLWVALRMD